MGKIIAACLLLLLAFWFISGYVFATLYDIHASWNPNTEEDLAGYKLYLNGVVVADIPAPNTTWAGAVDLAATDNVFDLTAYDLAGNESGKSPEVGIDPPPAKPTGFTITITITPH